MCDTGEKSVRVLSSHFISTHLSFNPVRSISLSAILLPCHLLGGGGQFCKERITTVFEIVEELYVSSLDNFFNPGRCSSSLIL